MTVNFREGKLSSVLLDADGTFEFDPDAWGVIADIDDFLEKAEKFGPNKVTPPTGSLRQQKVAALEYYVSIVRKFLETPEGKAQAARSALLFMLHAAVAYVQLLHEIESDVSRKDSALTRQQYLEFGAKAKSRKDLAFLCGLTLQGLRKWEAANNISPITPKTRK